MRYIQQCIDNNLEMCPPGLPGDRGASAQRPVEGGGRTDTGLALVAQLVTEKVGKQNGATPTLVQVNFRVDSAFYSCYPHFRIICETENSTEKTADTFTKPAEEEAIADTG